MIQSLTGRNMLKMAKKICRLLIIKSGLSLQWRKNRCVKEINKEIKCLNVILLLLLLISSFSFFVSVYLILL